MHNRFMSEDRKSMAGGNIKLGILQFNVIVLVKMICLVLPMCVLKSLNDLILYSPVDLLF